MAIVTSSIVYDILLIITSYFLFCYLKFKLYSRYHWKRMNIPYLEPTFYFGNALKCFVTQPIGKTLEEIYLANMDKPLFGVWLFNFKWVVLTDVDMIKNVLVKDFPNFRNRMEDNYMKNQPLEWNLFNLNDLTWRNLRLKLAPAFTTGKMKVIFSMMVQCGEQLEEFLKIPASTGETIDVKDISARFTTDFISICGYGIESNSLKNPNSEFLRHGLEFFRPRTKSFWIIMLLFKIPFLKRFFKFQKRRKEMIDFFMNTFKENVEYREKNNVKRNDFMDLIIQLKNKGTVEGGDKEATNEASDGFTLEEAASQFFIFFFANFESSVNLMQFTLYELALNPDIQTKLQNEIDSILLKYNNELTYEAVQEMIYLDCVVHEALRTHPPIPALFRLCSEDYTFPGTDITIKKGTTLVLSVNGIHKDPKYYPNPEKFDPDRFAPEEKSKRDKVLFLPFGEGPRMCIGNRFAMLQAKCGLIYVFSKYNVHVAPTTPIPLKLHTKSLLTTSDQGIELKITMRNV